jgi:glucuronoarabinoxylan endo-1,4-beta-xylanase
VNMKKSLLLTIAAVLISNAFAGPATINLSAEKQLIRGYGGMNYPGWIDDLTAAQRETAFGNGNGQLGFTILRIHVDPNKNNWQREVATAKSAIEHGALVFASPWNPPDDMRESYNCTSNCGGADGKTTYRLKASKYADYAKHLDDFVTFMKNNGVELYAISIQNEPDYDSGWLYWTPTEIVNFLKNHARSIKCRIMAPESFQYVKAMSDPILNDAQALANMDILGAHLYGTQVSQFPYPFFKSKGAGKELWMTEVYTDSKNDADVWPMALDVAVHIHNSMVEAEFQSYVWWYIRRSYGPMKENGTISKRGYMMAHFSKFVRQGYLRVDATKSPETDVLVSAYKSADSVVIVAINKKTSAVNQQFNISNINGTIAKVTGKRSSETENLVAIADINLTNGSFTASLPARSVTTFVGIRQGTTTPSSSSTAPSSSSLASSSSSAAIPSVVCNVDNLKSPYTGCNSIPRPNIICSDGTTSGSATFNVGGSDITGWNYSGGTHDFCNSGTRAVNLSAVTCGSTSVTLNPPISCGSFIIVAPSSSSSSVAESSSSSEDLTPIINSGLSTLGTQLSTYYSLKGEPLGNAKPQKAGIYIVKQGNSVKKIAVR